MSQERIYRGKDVEMLLTAKTVHQSFTSNLADLSLIRINWTPEYATGLGEKINSAMDNYLGLDKKKELREATAKLNKLVEPAYRDLSFLKTQLAVDFDADNNNLQHILRTLGLDKNLSASLRGNQESMIQALLTFKKGMTDELKAEIAEKGTNPALIDKIIGYANEIIEAEISQESLKETTKEVSAEAVMLFNEIYSEIIGICKIASNYYHNDPLKKAQFTYSNVLENMSHVKAATEA